MKKLVWLMLAWLIVMGTNCFAAATHYVRTDGGTGAQCTGLFDAAYTSGTGQPCAVNHPNWVFPPRGESTTRAAASGDVVVIHGTENGTGSYRIGCQNSTNCQDATKNLQNSSYCSAAGAYDCYMGTVPSNVTVIGCSTTGCASNAARPELWGAGRIQQVMQLSSNDTLRDVNITDHASCGGGSTLYSCASDSSTYKSELSSKDGLKLTSTTGVVLTNVWIHGLYFNGIRAGFAQNLTFNGDSLGATTIEYNYLSGMDMDECNNNGTCGVQPGNFVNMIGNSPDQMVSISWNGCVEDAASPGTAKVSGCETSYGDGFGTSTSSGNWTLNYLKMIHNTSDGLDLRYCSNSGCSVDVRNSYFGGNAGNQFKAAGNLIAYNNLIEGDCDFFVGKSYRGSNFTDCRALGDTLFFGFQNASITKKFIGNTVVNNRGNIFFDTASYGSYKCTAPNTIELRNNIITSSGKANNLGGGTVAYQYLCPNDGSDTNCGSGCESVTITQTDNVIYGLTTNPSGTNTVFTNPNFSGTYIGSTAAVKLSASSTNSIGTGTTSTTQPTTDLNGFSRGTSYDRGFLEFGSTYSTSSTCPNDIIEGSEVCDTNQVNGQTCYTQGFSAQTGSVTCNGSCSAYVTSTCVARACGDGYLEATETCETAQTTACTNLGYTTGTATCNSSCSGYDTSSCSNTAGSFPSTGILDTFTGSNGPLSSNWVQNYGGTDAQIISSNAMAYQAGNYGENAVSWVPKTDYADTEVYATLTALPASGNGFALFARADNIYTNDYHVTWVYNSSGTDAVTISKFVSGVGSVLSSQAFELAVGDKIGLKIVGSNIQLWKYTSSAWSLVTTVTDSSLTSGKIGVYMSDTTERLDDVGGGTVSTVSSSTPDVIYNGRVVCGGRTVTQ